MVSQVLAPLLVYPKISNTTFKYELYIVSVCKTLEGLYSWGSLFFVRNVVYGKQRRQEVYFHERDFIEVWIVDLYSTLK